MPQDLVPTILHIPAGVGIDQKLRAELVQPGQANLYAQNVRLTKVGALAKRAGYTIQTPLRMDGSARPGVLSMFGRRKETCCIAADFRLDSFSVVLGVQSTIGLVPEIHCERFPVASIGPSSLDGTVESIDVAFANGMYFVAAAYLDSGLPGVNATYKMTVWVVDRTTRAVVARVPVPSTGTAFTAAMHMKIVAAGPTTIVLVVTQGANVFGFRLNATNSATIHAGFGAAVNLANDSTGADLDACSLETSFAIVYPNNSAATHRVTVKRFDTALALLFAGTSITTNNQTTSAVAIDGSENDNLWVAWSDTLTGGACKVVALAPDCTTITGTAYSAFTTESGTPNRLGIKRKNATDAWVNGRGQSSTTNNWFHISWRQVRIVAGACANVMGPDGTNTNTGRVLGWTPYSQPFFCGARAYMWQVNSNEPNGTSTATVPVGNMVATDITFWNTNFQRPVANPAAGLQSYARDAFWSGRHVVTIDTNTAATVCVVKKNNVEASIDIIETDCVSTARWQHASHNGVEYLSGGVIAGYDGNQVFESNYMAPPTMRAVDSGAAGNVNGTVSYCCIIEWTDAEGNVHWSEPSAPTTLTVVNHQVNVTMLGYGVTCKDGQTETWNGALPPIDAPFGGQRMRYKVYRTKNGGGAFYLVTSFPVLGGANSPPIVDNLSDATLGANEQLYTVPGTTGNALFRRAPPSSVGLCDYQGTLLSITEDRKSVVSTGQQVLGEGAWWSPILQAPIGDELTAIREMDGVAYIWSRKGIYATSFEPPTDSGNSGGIQFATVRRVTSEVGCTEPRSLCRTSLGIFFRSKRGIEILTRAGAVEWIGQKVQETVNLYPVVTSAVYVERDDVVIITLATSESAGVAQGPSIGLVYDVSNGVWISFDDYKNVAGTDFAPLQCAAVVYNGAGEYVHAWGDVLYAYTMVQRTDGVCLDYVYYYEAFYETAWMKLGLQQEHQFWQSLLLYEQKDACQLKVEVAYDWLAYSSADDKIAAPALVAANPHQIELRTKPRRQAFKVRVRDQDPTPTGVTTGAGLNFVGLSIDVAPHHGSTKSTPHLAASARM